MPTFCGYVKGSHGVFPLPAPATAEILRGVPWRKLDIEGELVTPTGAAIITEVASEFGPLPAMAVDSIGYGAGKGDFGIPNVLRVMIGEEVTHNQDIRASQSSRRTLMTSIPRSKRPPWSDFSLRARSTST